MKLMVDIDIKSPAHTISYPDPIMLVGSCFTEHIGGRLADYKLPVHQNPHGILFDPLSVCHALQSYLTPTLYKPDDFFFLNDVWQSWYHHSRFSGVDKEEVLSQVNQSQAEAHIFLKKAKWLIITLGSAFSYQLVEEQQPVANCHKAPGQWFNKNLLTSEDISVNLLYTVRLLHGFNPGLRVIFTISPVRHLRDGVVENNRSKARLIEAVHQVVDKLDYCSYFPAYELVIDVLRDYRFYDIDLAHPNYAATAFVFDHFVQSFIHPETRVMMEEVKQIVNAFRHKPFQPSTGAHQRFLELSLAKTRKLQQQLPQLDFSNELDYFGGAAPTAL